MSSFRGFSRAVLTLHRPVRGGNEVRPEVLLKSRRSMGKGPSLRASGSSQRCPQRRRRALREDCLPRRRRLPLVAADRRAAVAASERSPHHPTSCRDQRSAWSSNALRLMPSRGCATGISPARSNLPARTAARRLPARRERHSHREIPAHLTTSGYRRGASAARASLRAVCR
jgi:hypothetical protein